MMTETVIGAPDTTAEASRAVQPDDSLLLAFIGPNRDIYRETIKKMRAKDPALRKIVATWCWPAFLITLPWLCYRKLYGWAAILIGCAVAIGFIFPTSSNSSTIGGFLVFAIFAKPIYVQHALRRVAKLRERAANEEELEALVKQAGGVSIPGAVVGTFLLIGLGMLSLISLVSRT